MAEEFRNDPLKTNIIDDFGFVEGPLAIRIYNKGHYGTPIKDGVKLNGFEILHLFELSRILVYQNGNQINETDIVNYYEIRIPNFIIRYMVYKDLRNRGYIVNLGEGSAFFFRLYERNATPLKDPAKFYVSPLAEGTSILLKELEELIQLSEVSEKDLIFGLVDANGDVSYLKINELEISESKNNNLQSIEKFNWKIESDLYEKNLNSSLN